MKSVLKLGSMVIFAIGMFYLMQLNLEQKQEKQEQKDTISESSVIYSDVGIEESEEKAKK